VYVLSNFEQECTAKGIFVRSDTYFDTGPFRKCSVDIRTFVCAATLVSDGWYPSVSEVIMLDTGW
jgi:hypothetical protein